MMYASSPYGELVRLFDQGTYHQGRDVIEAFERSQESLDGSVLSHVNVDERVGYRQMKALIFLHVYGKSDMYRALGLHYIHRGVPLHERSMVVSKRLKEFTKLVHPDKVHHCVKNREAVHEAFLILQGMKQQFRLHPGGDDGPDDAFEGIKRNDGYEWWSTWDAEEDEDSQTCDEEDAVHLEGLSIRALRDEVRVREEALRRGSRDYSDIMLRQRLLRARAVLSQAVDDERQRSSSAVSNGGGFLP